MRYNTLSEKKRSSVTPKSSALSTTPGCVIIIICQHILLWSALYVAASAIYTLAIDAVMTNNIPSTVMFLTASCLSLFYLTLQNVTTHLRRTARDRWQSERVDTYQSLATFCLRRFLVLTWVVTAVLAVVLTASRGILWPCHSEEDAKVRDIIPLDIGTACVVNRAEILASIIAALASASLFILSHMVIEPSRCHLFGYIKEQDLLPLFLPYRKSTDHPPLFSDMSFKYRSSSSLASQPLYNPSLASVSPPRHPLGLGIYTGYRSAHSIRSAPSLLHPRPSLSSIRSHASISHLTPPPTEPLPPLPAYIPQKYRQPSTAQNAIYPPPVPRNPYAHHSNLSLNDNTDNIRIIPPTPVLSRHNLASLNRTNNDSLNSLSSVYSRSISGDKRPRMLSETGRTASESSTTSTIRRSPLGAMRLANNPEILVMQQQQQSRYSGEISDDDDDEAAIQARIRRVDSWEGLVKMSEQEGYVERQSGLSRFSAKPLNVRKTRMDCDNVF